MKKIAGILFATLLFGCSNQDAVPPSPPQLWHGITISIETRPAPPQSGMTEFLVLATEGKHHQPAYDLLMNLRTADSDAWTQAIQDGQTGVYRRAVLLAPGERSTLQIQVKRGEMIDVLGFPLTLTDK